MKKLLLATIFLLPVAAYAEKYTGEEQYQISVKCHEYVGVPGGAADYKKCFNQMEQQFLEKRRAKQSELNPEIKNQAGFVSTVQFIDSLKKAIMESQSTKRVMDAFDCINNGAYGAYNCNGQAGMIGQQMNSQIDWASGNATVNIGAEINEFKDKELFSASIKENSGLFKTVTFNDNISTITVSDNSGNNITFKINMNSPGDSHVVDAKIPLNIKNTITQVYSKKGITVEDNMLFQIIENWYKSSPVMAGVNFSNVADGLINNTDQRKDFLKYVKAQAKVAVKAVDDDE